MHRYGYMEEIDVLEAVMSENVLNAIRPVYGLSTRDTSANAVPPISGNNSDPLLIEMQASSIELIRKKMTFIVSKHNVALRRRGLEDGRFKKLARSIITIPLEVYTSLHSAFNDQCK